MLHDENKYSLTQSITENYVHNICSSYLYMTFTNFSLSNSTIKDAEYIL